MKNFFCTIALDFEADTEDEARREMINYLTGIDGRDIEVTEVVEAQSLYTINTFSESYADAFPQVGDRVAHKTTAQKGVVTHVLVEDAIAAVHYDQDQFASSVPIGLLVKVEGEGSHWRADDAGNIQRTEGYTEADAFRNGGAIFLDEFEDTSCPECGHETGHSNGWVVCDNCDWRVADDDYEANDEAERLARGHRAEYDRGYNDGVNVALDAIAYKLDQLRLTLRN